MKFVRYFIFLTVFSSVFLSFSLHCAHCGTKKKSKKSSFVVACRHQKIVIFVVSFIFFSLGCGCCCCKISYSKICQRKQTTTTCTIVIAHCSKKLGSFMVVDCFADHTLTLHRCVSCNLFMICWMIYVLRKTGKDEREIMNKQKNTHKNGARFIFTCFLLFRFGNCANARVLISLH